MQLWEFDGSNTSDLSLVQAGQVYPSYNLANFTWASLDGRMNETALSAEFQGSVREGAFGNGSVSFKVNWAMFVRGCDSTTVPFSDRSKLGGKRDLRPFSPPPQTYDQA